MYYTLLRFFTAATSPTKQPPPSNNNNHISNDCDYCHLTWRPSKGTDTTHFATPAEERRALE